MVEGAEPKELQISDLLDLDHLQTLLTNFCNSVGIASAIIDLYDRFFERLRRGESVNLPSVVSKNLCKDGILSSDRGPYNKRMVNWEKYDKLHGLRNKQR